MSRHLALDGAQAIAEAMRQINPDVVAAYPITPQTEIVQKFSTFVADGLVDTEFITVESEHSAMSACVGAAAAGARVMTATSSAGLALMWEILYVAASNRLPIVMPVVNRALSAPINIHCDHSDSMGARDAGWIQLFSETAQEAYDNAIQAPRIAEHPDVLLPVMVCQDGFITSHGLERIDALEDDQVRQFVGTLQPHMPLLDLEHPVTYGPLDFYDYYFEHKRQQVEAMRHAGPVILEVAEELPGSVAGGMATLSRTGWMMPRWRWWSSTPQPAPPGSWLTGCARRGSKPACSNCACSAPSRCKSWPRPCAMSGWWG